MIDFGEPVVVLCVAVLHFIRDTDHPHEMITAYRDALPPGSYLVLSHAATDNTDGSAR